MVKKKAPEDESHLCAHCGEKFPFKPKFCACCGLHSHVMMHGQGEDCVSCVSGLTREGEKKYGPYKPL